MAAAPTFGAAGCARYLVTRPLDPVLALSAPVALETVRRVSAGGDKVDSVLFMLRIRAPRDSTLLLVVQPPADARIRVVTPGGPDSVAALTPVIQIGSPALGVGRDAPRPPLRVRSGVSSPAVLTPGLPDGLLLVDSAVTTLGLVAPVRADHASFALRLHWYATPLVGGSPRDSVTLSRQAWRPDSSQVYSARVRTVPFTMVMAAGVGLCAVFLLATTR